MRQRRRHRQPEGQGTEQGQRGAAAGAARQRRHCRGRTCVDAAVAVSADGSSAVEAESGGLAGGGASALRLAAGLQTPAEDLGVLPLVPRGSVATEMAARLSQLSPADLLESDHVGQRNHRKKMLRLAAELQTIAEDLDVLPLVPPTPN